MEMRTGSPSQMRRSCPQLHDASRVVMAHIVPRSGEDNRGLRPASHPREAVAGVAPPYRQSFKIVTYILSKSF